jgi:hypothetical protein
VTRAAVAPGRRPRQLSPVRVHTGIALTLLGLGAAPARAQRAADPRAWLLGAGVASYALADVHGTGWGAEAIVRRRLGPRLVLQARITVIPSSTGFYDFEGAAADAGVGVVAGTGRFDVALVGGASGVAGGDSDGSFFTAGGGHLTAQATGWLGRTIRIYGNGAVRQLTGSGADYGVTSGSGGLAFSF